MKFSQYQLLKNRLFTADDKGQLIDRYKDSQQPEHLHPLVLAYIGDACYHLYVRTRLLHFDQSHVQLLNDFSMQIVSATWQARAYEAISSELTDKEQQIFKRAKNAKSHAPRAASVHDYHISTGFEAVLGYLQLNGEHERLNHICELSFQAAAKAMQQLHEQQSK